MGLTALKAARSGAGHRFDSCHLHTIRLFMKEYKIAVTTSTDKELDRACDIAFPAGKGYCGAGFTKDSLTEFYVFGKHSDMVRVFSALKRNGYTPTVRRL